MPVFNRTHERGYYVTWLRMLHSKVDIVPKETNEMRADYQLQYDELEAMLTKIIITWKHT